MKKIRKILLYTGVIVMSALFGYYIGVNKINVSWANYKPQVVATSKEPPPSTLHVDLSMFWTVLEKIEENYYDKKAIDPQKVVNGAISGMVESLDDPYTMYLPPQQNNDFKQSMAGQFTGIGAELGMNNKQIIVVAPLEGSPAEKAGIKAGDFVLKVDNSVISGWTLNQTVDKIRGPKGTDVTLTILHKGAEEAKEVKITRDTITVKSVYSWTKKVSEIDSLKQATFTPAQKNQKIAYIRLSQFGDNTNQEWVGIANKIALEIQQDKTIKGIVFDLRNNPGGYLTDAVFISSEFIKNGTIVIQEDGKGERLVMSVQRKGLLTDVPLYVLINKGSASASEIVSGALRDHNRAKLIGDVSFGKGTVQSAEDLGGGAGIHVTIAKWLTPNEIWVHKKGLTPDISVELDPKDPARDTQLERAVQELVQ